MLTPAIFERQMLEYEKIQKDMFFVLEQQGYTAGVRVLRRIYYGDDGAGQD